MLQYLYAWVLRQVDQTDWPGNSQSNWQTHSAEGSCCAALVLSALQYRSPHHTRQQGDAMQRAQRKLDVWEELPPRSTKDILVTMETPTSSQTDITGFASWPKQGAKDPPYLLSNQLEVRSPQVDVCVERRMAMTTAEGTQTRIDPLASEKQTERKREAWGGVRLLRLNISCLPQEPLATCEQRHTHTHTLWDKQVIGRVGEKDRWSRRDEDRQIK